MGINLERFISNTCCNSCQGFYDLYVETNVRIRSKLGMKEVIVRRQLGHCCDWCAGLAGIYDANNAPDNIYKRHRNCRCMVTYKTDGKGYQDVYSKKEYKTQRKSRLERIEEIQNEKNKRLPFDQERLEAKNNGDKFYDATKEWEALADPSKLAIEEKKSVTIDGIKYKIDGKHVYINLEKYEKNTIESFAKKYGGVVQYCPVVQDPERINTPDFLYNGNRYDLKTFGLKHPEVNNDRLFINYLGKKKTKRQASNFLLDYGRTNINDMQAIKQAADLFDNAFTKYIDTIVLMKDGNIVKILERI